MLNKTIVYVAGPYSHQDPEVRVDRFHALTEYAAHLVNKGHIVYSPITHSHPLELAMNAGVQPTEYWLEFDRVFMDVCDECHVVQLDGWDQSKGVAYEMQYFQDQEKPVTLVEVVE